MGVKFYCREELRGGANQPDTGQIVSTSYARTGMEAVKGSTGEMFDKKEEMREVLVLQMKIVLSFFLSYATITQVYLPPAVCLNPNKRVGHVTFLDQVLQ